MTLWDTQTKMHQSKERIHILGWFVCLFLKSTITIGKHLHPQVTRK